MWVQFLCRKCVIFIPFHVTLSTLSKVIQNLFHFIIYLKSIPKKLKKLKKMLLRIHPPNQGYLKAHSLYSNHFFRLVCSIAITTQKKNHIIECTLPLHVIYFSLQTVHSLCRVGVTTYDYDVPLWRNRILRIQDRNTTKR